MPAAPHGHAWGRTPGDRGGSRVVRGDPGGLQEQGRRGGGGWGVRSQRPGGGWKGCLWRGRGARRSSSASRRAPWLCRSPGGICSGCSSRRVLVLSAWSPSLEEAEEPELGGEEGPNRQLVWLVLEQIQDPMNLGALLRSAYFLGVDRVVTSQRDSCPLTPTVSKASSGAMEVFDVYSTDDLRSFLKAKAAEGWEVLGTVSKPEEVENVPVISCSEFRWNKPIIIVIGNEGDGLSLETQLLCHRMLAIPPGRALHPGIESLNVSVATGKNTSDAQGHQSKFLHLKISSI
uniref:Mitochondrial rRNA methyltransferase 1 n=1 Tax=Anas zonorhyncha TaxID=75864 RepID=A0A8B9UNE0_9AVES